MQTNPAVNQVWFRGIKRST